MKKIKFGENPVIGGKALMEWDREWVPVKGGFLMPQPQLRFSVGLYRALRHGELMYIGQAVDRTGGLAKRIADFRRPSPSGRNHNAGLLINEHLASLDLEVLITGSDRSAREIAELLKTPMIRLHNPRWNWQDTPYMIQGIAA